MNDTIKRFRKYKKGGFVNKFLPGGKTEGEFYSDSGIIRRHNSDGTDTQITMNKNGNFQWIQPDGRLVRVGNIYTLDNNTYFNIPNEGLLLTLDSESMGPKGYEGYWYKRKKNPNKGESNGWDGWFIGNGLSKTSYPELIRLFGDPDSSEFLIETIKIGDEIYLIAKSKNRTPMTQDLLAFIMRNNSNADITTLKLSNPELYRLIQHSPDFIQNALYSLYHLYGAGYTNPNHKKYHKDTAKIIKALRNKDYQTLANIIRNYDNTYKTRRNREATYIENNLNNYVANRK